MRSRSTASVTRSRWTIRLSTWVNFNNRYWPAHYLIDRQGRVVYTHFGEGKYDVTENNIRYLLGLKEKGETIQVEAPTFAPGQTPETYLGYAQGGQLRRQGTRGARCAGRLPLPRLPAGMTNGR